MKIKSIPLIGFASPAFALAALGLPVVVILPPLYAELGLSLTTVGTIFMLTRMFDVGTDPLFGVLGDKIRTRWGRRKPAMAVAVPILMFGVYRVFMPSGPVSAVDLLVSMLLMYVGWTMLTLAHTAWASELTDNYNERSRVMSYLQFVGLIGAVIVLGIPAVVDRISPDANMLMRAEVMGWLVLTSLPLLVAISLWSLPEPRISSVNQPDFRVALRSILANAPLRRLLFADLLMGLQGGINGSVHFFFVIHVLKLPTSAGLYLVAIFLTGLVCVPFFLKLSYRFGKHRTLCFGAIQSSLTTACFFVIPDESFFITLGVFIMIGVNFGAKDMLMRSMMADVIDQDHLATGVEQSALYYSLLTLTAKLGGALAVGIVFPMLDWVGFDPSGTNSTEVIEGVRMVVATTPTLVTIAVAILMWRFPLDKEAQLAIRRELAAQPGYRKSTESHGLGR